MKSFIIILYSVFVTINLLYAGGGTLRSIVVHENHGLDRVKEYIECSVQVDHNQFPIENGKLIAKNDDTGKIIICQIIDKTMVNDRILIRFIFPVSMTAHQTTKFNLELSTESEKPVSNLTMRGENTDLIIENSFYRADLTKNTEIEPQSYDSGQIREIFVKMGLNQLLTNAEDRVHWAPNFKKPELEWYTTIAHWQSPDHYQVKRGPYLIETRRKGPAPGHPEIMLTAVYKFYADLRYFRFYSCMEMKENIWLELLRNDEMTFDSTFTHLAFQRPDGNIVDVSFTERYELLKKDPIENTSPWICFYNDDSGLAFGSIRIKYDISNQFGVPSAVYQPHTQIGEWLAGIKYWNRRLIHDHLTYVPKGSRYTEDNAYLFFSANEQNKFKEISHMTECLRNPLVVVIK